MTAITSGKGFGMNRAFLLMTDRDREKLVGYLGVGPRDYEEAWRIWEEIDRNDFSLKSMALHFQKNKLLAEKYKFQDILDRLTVSLADENHIFNRVLREKKSLLIENARSDSDACNGVGDILGVDSFLLIPLISKNRRIGVLLADNFVTGKPITLQDMQSLETFAFPVAFGLERASLYERLHEEVDKLTVANIKLHEQQELLVRMERMALVGRITSSIAHSIRNPLMVIGGFARSLLKSIQPDDPKRQFLDSIVNEAKHLENVLEDVLNYSDSQYPVMDEWDLNQLVTEVNNELRERLGTLGINLILALQSSLPKVRVDYKQFSYCLKTIILNAVNLSGHAGEIVLATRVTADDAVVEIIDRRVWLSPLQIEQLVTPFAATEDLGKGAGLQLCKIILDKHHSDFEISALPEGGTLYAIRIPLNREVGR
jgi:signal transduction histidine kinase